MPNGGYQPDTKAPSSRRADFDLLRRVRLIEGAGGVPGPPGADGAPGAPGAAGLPGGATYSQLVGGAISQVVTHSLNTRDAVVEVYRMSAPYDRIDCDVEHTDANKVTLRFLAAPAVNAYQVIIVATGSSGGGGGGGGTTILDGIGPPSTGVGQDGDYYLDTASDTLYGPKDSAGYDSPRFTNTDTDVPDTTMTGVYRLGMEYRFLVAGQITGARWRREATSDATPKQMFLFRADGTFVANTVFTSETAGVAGWVRASFVTPISLNPSEQWVIAFDIPSTGPVGYTASPGPTMLDPTKATYIQARYVATVGGTTFPNTVQANVNRFVDIEFRPAGSNIWPVAMESGGGTPATLGYTHVQSVPAAVWTINHSLTFQPNVACLDTADDVIEGDVSYDSPTLITVTYSAATGGKAHLS